MHTTTDNRLKVLVAGNVARGPILDAGIDAVFLDSTRKPDLIAAIPGFNALVYRSESPIGDDVFMHAPLLKLLVRPGVGMDAIDLRAAARRGITVVNAPTGNTISVAEHAIGLILSCLRHTPQAHYSTKGGEWRKNDFHGMELNGKTVGIVGLGRIGKAVARRLAAFGVRLVSFDPYVHPEEFAAIGVIRAASLDELMQSSDVVTIHVPLTDSTRRIIDARRISLLRPTAVLVNTSRGAVVDCDALVAAVNSKRLLAAALDVFEEEPLLPCALHDCGNIILTPHLGGSTREALIRISTEVAERILEFGQSTQPALAANDSPVKSVL